MPHCVPSAVIVPDSSVLNPVIESRFGTVAPGAFPLYDEEMDTRHRLHILERKEVVLLTLIAIVGGALIFTLGLHFGKRTSVPASQDEILAEQDPGEVKTVPDSIPNRQDLTEQGKGVPEASDEAIQDALKTEVEKNDARLDEPRQVTLPGKPKGKGGATGLKSEEAKAVANAETKAAVPKAALKFTLQVGSYPTDVEAQTQMGVLEAKGLQPFLKSVKLGEKGNWYRVYVGEYPTKEEAEKAGADFKGKEVFPSFIVAKYPE